LVPRIVRQAGRELDLRDQPGTQAAWIQRQGPIVVTATSAEASALLVESESRDEKEHRRLRARKRPATPRLGDPVRSGRQIPGRRLQELNSGLHDPGEVEGLAEPERDVDNAWGVDLAALRNIRHEIDRASERLESHDPSADGSRRVPHLAPITPVPRADEELPELRFRQAKLSPHGRSTLG